MSDIIIKVKNLTDKIQIPFYGTDDSAGADLYAYIKPDPVFGDDTKVIRPGETEVISAGIAVEIPKGYAGMIYARSGLSINNGLAPANKVGVIDADYRGEIKVALHNHGSEPYVVNDGDRIAQMIIHKVPSVKYVPVDELSDTERGAGGFGSTGR